MAADWGNLPSNLIDMVSKKLHDAEDTVFFKAVCREWRNHTSTSDNPRQLPWVLSRIDNNHLHFYTSSFHYYTCDLPPGNYVTDTEKQNLLRYTGDYYTCVSLYNPITRTTTELPLFPEIVSWCKPIHTGKDMTVLLWGNYNVKETCTVGFYTHGAPKWIVVKGPFNRGGGHTYCKNVCYVNTEKGTNIYDASTGCLLDFIKNPNPISTPAEPLDDYMSDYYVVEVDGRIMLVKWIKVSDDYFGDGENYFSVYRLEGVSGDLRWVPIHNLGGCEIFLDTFSVFGLRRTPMSGYRGNCIHYIKMVSKDGDIIFPLWRRFLETDEDEEVTDVILDLPNWFRPSLVV